MDALLERIIYLIKEMQRDGKTTIEIEFRTLASMYQILNMMKQITNITDWCKEGYM